MNIRDAKFQVHVLRLDSAKAVECLRSLGPGHGMTFHPDMSHAAEMQINPITFDAQENAARRAQRKAQTMAWLQAQLTFTNAIDVASTTVTTDGKQPLDNGATPISPAAFSNDQLTLLQLIAEHPCIAIAELYARIGSLSHGSRVKTRLEEAGFIEEVQKLQTKGRYKSVYGLTAKGKQLYERISKTPLA